jgi:hypothetical protein
MTTARHREGGHGLSFSLNILMMPLHSVHRLLLMPEAYKGCQSATCDVVVVAMCSVWWGRVGGPLLHELKQSERRSTFTILLALKRTQSSQVAARMSGMLRDVCYRYLYARF